MTFNPTAGFAVVAVLMLSGGAALAEINELDSANYVMPGCRNYIGENPKGGDIFKTGLCWGLISSLTYKTEDACLPTTVTQTLSLSGSSMMARLPPRPVSVPSIEVA